MSLQRGREGSGGSIMSPGGSGRLWVRGQGCKLTGFVTVRHGESFPPEARGPRARGKDCHVRWVAFAARPAQPAVPEARGETPPGRGRVHHPARRPGGRRPGAWPAQLGRAEAGLRSAFRAGKARPRPAPLGDLAFLRRRRPGLDGARRGRAQAAFRRSLPGRTPAQRPGRAGQQNGRGPARGTRRPQRGPARGRGSAGRPAVLRGGRRHAAPPAGRPAGVPPRRPDHRPPGEGAAAAPHPR